LKTRIEFLRFYRLNIIIFCCNLFQTVNIVNIMFHGISCYFLVIPYRLVIYFDYASRSATVDQSVWSVGRSNQYFSLDTIFIGQFNNMLLWGNINLGKMRLCVIDIAKHILNCVKHTVDKCKSFPTSNVENCTVILLYIIIIYYISLY